MQALITIVLLILSNTFMTLAWYGHLKFKDIPWLSNVSLPVIILISWGIAFFEYCFQVPANRFGYTGNNGPFTLVQLKVIQEVITLGVFLIFAFTVFKTIEFRWNHAAGMILLVGAVYLIFME